MDAFVIDPEERIELNELDRCRLEDILKEPLDDEAIQMATDPLDNLPLTIRKLQFTPDFPELPAPVIDFNLLVPKSEEAEYAQVVEPSDPIQLLWNGQIESYKRCEKESSRKLEIIRKFRTKKLPVMNFEEITTISKELNESRLSPSCVAVSNKYVLIGFSNSWVSVYTTEGTEIRKLKVGNESQISHFGCASSIDISYDESWCVSGYEKGQVAVWDLNTGYNIRISNSIFSCPVLNAKFWKYQRQFVVFSDVKGNLASVECVKTLLTTTLDTSMIFRG
jgi:WD40 repeat protein